MNLIARLTMMCCAILMAAVSLVKADSQGGRKIYQEHCAACHGETLDGGIGSSFRDHIWNYGKDPDLIGMNIKFGILNLEMPAWKDILSDDDIKSVVTFIVEQDKMSTLKAPIIAAHIKTELYGLKLEVLNDSLVEPWSLAFMDKDTALVTDKVGKLYLMKKGKIQPDTITGLPDDIVSTGQGGLLDVALDPEYGDNGWVYLSYSQERPKAKGQKRAGAMTRIIRGRVKENSWVDQQILFEAAEEFYSTTRHHYGSRIVFDGEGYLYFSVGDRGAKKQAQDLSRPNGKVHRIHKDGRIPRDNPFVNQPGAIPSIFSYGHRNPQGMAVHPASQQVWSTEHGPMGGDELNHVRRGKNFGWPEITYGLDYDGSVISALTAKPGMEQPVHHWTPSIAVCDIDFYRGDLFPKWQNDLLVTSLKYVDLRRLVIRDEKVVHEEVLLKGVGRMRSVTVGPEGAIYVLVNQPSLILRLTPKNDPET
ncbi:MAG: glucose sorbosone dehydrogenase [Alphaproteobacteria bacterium]|nr:MAG: glucose sorbosone dehydrogenase [Alphaproteobacteria bacterium]